MSKTSISTSNAAAVKLWSEKQFRDIAKASYFSRFMGTSPESMCQTDTSLESKKGDRITFNLIPRLTGAGVTEGQTLEGNEESLNNYTFSVNLGLLRHAVRDDGSMTRQRAMFEVTEAQSYAIRTWMTEQIDQKAFNALTASPTTIIGGNGTKYTSGTTASAALTTSHLLTPDLISQIKAGAVTGYNRGQTPLRPLMINGKKHYVLLVHPDVAYDLKTNTDWQTAQQNANVRSLEGNPIFNGALGMWDNVIIHEHENIPIETTWGSGSDVPGAKCQFLGAQALVWAWGQRPSFKTKEFDYDEEMGVSCRMVYGVAKPVFNGLDYGSIAVYVARTQISDAA